MREVKEAKLNISKNKMKFIVLENDGRSLKPFELSEIEAKDREEAYDFADESSCNGLSGCWIMTEEEFKQLKEVVNK